MTNLHVINHNFSSTIKIYLYEITSLNLLVIYMGIYINTSQHFKHQTIFSTDVFFSVPDINQQHHLLFNYYAIRTIVFYRHLVYDIQSMFMSRNSKFLAYERI